ncbi:hypothetical protein D3C87_1347400 [compost metagenome]
MHKSHKNSFVFSFFSWYIRYILKRDFSAYVFNDFKLRGEEAVLLLANHFSWWDGFLMFQLNRLLFKKEFHVLVTDEDYKKHWFLKYVGAFAAEGKGKDVVETLLYAGQLLNDPNNLVLMFPQGKLYSVYNGSIAFEKGVMQVVNGSGKKFQIVFAANLIDLSTRKPQLQTQLAGWEAEEYMSLQLLKSEYNKHYTQALKNQNKLAG